MVVKQRVGKLAVTMEKTKVAKTVVVKIVVEQAVVVVEAMRVAKMLKTAAGKMAEVARIKPAIYHTTRLTSVIHVCYILVQGSRTQRLLTDRRTSRTFFGRPGVNLNMLYLLKRRLHFSDLQAIELKRLKKITLVTM